MIGRTPQGVRGLKPRGTITIPKESKGRTPQGVRGLKRFVFVELCEVSKSHSARSAWIETFCFCRVM